MADPDRFDADPDPTFHADPDPNFSSKSSTIFCQNLTKLVMCNFLRNNAGGMARGEG